MDETVVAQVDGNVIDPTALDVEENQVARLQVVAIDFLAMTAGHGIGGARQVKRGVVERIFHQTTAVEPFTWAAAAPTVGSTEDVHRTAQDVAAFLVGHRWHQLAVILAGERGVFRLFAALARRSRSMGFRGETVNVGKTLLTIGGVGGQWH